MIMSLVRLLSAGKSLVGVREVREPLPADKQMRLPKFISPQNPFVSRKRTQGRGVDATEDIAEQAAPASRSRLPQGREQRVEANTRSRSRAHRWQRERQPRGWARQTRFSRFAESARPKKSADSAFHEAAVQGELSLDKVQVVRNDLSDADLEVVRGALQPVAPRWR